MKLSNSSMDILALHSAGRLVQDFETLMGIKHVVIIPYQSINQSINVLTSMRVGRQKQSHFPTLFSCFLHHMRAVSHLSAVFTVCYQVS